MSNFKDHLHETPYYELLLNMKNRASQIECKYNFLANGNTQSERRRRVLLNAYTSHRETLGSQSKSIMNI